uniref:Uncharacterized protein n=1 Tax=Hippocampus comes TaxID=109280 RepID=A0A3Q3D242_HIPCM
MLMPHLHQAISLDDDLVTGDLGDGMTVRTTSLSTRKKSQSSTEPRGPISPDGDVYRRSHAREAACMPRLMTEGWEKMSTWKMPLIGNGNSRIVLTVIDVLICELEVAHRYLEGKFEALKILQGKAILEQATSHTKSLLQKSEERAKDLEKVLCFLLPTDSSSVILEMLGYKSNHGSHEICYPLWKRQLEAKIKAARKDVSQLMEAQRGVMKRPIPERYIQMTIPEALETAKQRLQALSSRLKRYTQENEARRINRLFATQPAKVYAQWQGPNSRADPPRLETERYWKGIWEKEFAHNSSAQCW